ncbi:MAG TPA: ATP-binding protein, partial [Allocoleopsis sp.]
RGRQIIAELRDNIAFFSPDQPTCVLFTGYIGCGKSTELLRLKAELEQEGFHMVYFESSEDLELDDVDIVDVLLSSARRVIQSLDQFELEKTSRLNELLQGAAKLLLSEVKLKEFEVGLPKVEGLPEVRATVKQQGEFSVGLGIAKITAKVKNDATLRERLNQYLGPQKNKLLEAIKRLVAE